MPFGLYSLLALPTLSLVFMGFKAPSTPFRLPLTTEEKETLWPHVQPAMERIGESEAFFVFEMKKKQRVSMFLRYSFLAFITHNSPATTLAQHMSVCRRESGLLYSWIWWEFDFVSRTFRPPRRSFHSSNVPVCPIQMQAVVRLSVPRQQFKKILANYDWKATRYLQGRLTNGLPEM